MKTIKIKLWATYLCIAAIGVSCEKADFSENLTSENASMTTDKNGFVSATPRALNVIYFTPTDNDAKPDYRRRISNIMINTQSYVKKWMEHWGYSNSTFGLQINPSSQMVNIIRIEGKLTKDEYPYSGGYQKIIPEIKEYFANNDDVEPTSEHFLVILPERMEGDQIGGVPFYGVGKYCFALDAGADMTWDNMGAGGQPGNEAGWIGGLIHELGHGINLPHNSQKRSEYIDFGTSLMDNGNHVIKVGKIDRTFMTASDAAILSENEIFSPIEDNFYGQVSYKLTELKSKFENGSLNVNGKFESDTPVKKIIVNQDPEGRSNYNQIGWVANPDADDTFSVSMPVAELFQVTNTNYTLKVMFVFENGTTRQINLGDYKYINGETNVDHLQIRDILNRDNWEVIDADSEEDTGAASNMLDDNRATVWHTEWKRSLPDHPHYFVVDMGAETTVDGLAFQNRDNLNGVIKDCEIFTSTDNINWTSEGQYHLKRQSSWQYTAFSTRKNIRYVKVVTQNSHGDFNYTHLAEFGAYLD